LVGIARRCLLRQIVGYVFAMVCGWHVLCVGNRPCPCRAHTQVCHYLRAALTREFVRRHSPTASLHGSRDVGRLRLLSNNRGPIALAQYGRRRTRTPRRQFPPVCSPLGLAPPCAAHLSRTTAHVLAGRVCLHDGRRNEGCLPYYRPWPADRRTDSADFANAHGRRRQTCRPAHLRSGRVRPNGVRSASAHPPPTRIHRASDEAGGHEASARRDLTPPHQGATPS